MITQPMPFDVLGFEFLPQFLTLQNSLGLECPGAFEAQQRKPDSSLRKLAQVRKHLTLAERVKHSIVGDEQDATALKRHCQPPPESFGSSENNPATTTECCR